MFTQKNGPESEVPKPKNKDNEKLLFVLNMKRQSLMSELSLCNTVAGISSKTDANKMISEINQKISLIDKQIEELTNPKTINGVRPSK